ncbi:hypothetical protein Pelo_3646 [Pelomyxa schiedti]|nr:hypothetical protein Pelo_3646 [Pelomyxa schiedti]
MSKKSSSSERDKSVKRSVSVGGGRSLSPPMNRTTSTSLYEMNLTPQFDRTTPLPGSGRVSILRSDFAKLEKQTATVVGAGEALMMSDLVQEQGAELLSGEVSNGVGEARGVAVVTDGEPELELELEEAEVVELEVEEPEPEEEEEMAPAADVWGFKTEDVVVPDPEFLNGPLRSGKTPVPSDLKDSQSEVKSVSPRPVEVPLKEKGSSSSSSKKQKQKSSSKSSSSSRKKKVEPVDTANTDEHPVVELPQVEVPVETGPEHPDTTDAEEVIKVPKEEDFPTLDELPEAEQVFEPQLEAKKMRIHNLVTERRFDHKSSSSSHKKRKHSSTSAKSPRIPKDEGIPEPGISLPVEIPVQPLEAEVATPKSVDDSPTVESTATVEIESTPEPPTEPEVLKQPEITIESLELPRQIDEEAKVTPPCEPEVSTEPVPEPKVDTPEEPQPEPKIETSEEPQPEPKVETPAESLPEPKVETPPEEPQPEPKVETPEEPPPEPKVETPPEEPQPEPKVETPEEPQPEPKVETPEEPLPEPKVEIQEEAAHEPELVSREKVESPGEPIIDVIPEIKPEPHSYSIEVTEGKPIVEIPQTEEPASTTCAEDSNPHDVSTTTEPQIDHDADIPPVIESHQEMPPLEPLVTKTSSSSKKKAPITEVPETLPPVVQSSEKTNLPRPRPRPRHRHRHRPKPEMLDKCIQAPEIPEVEQPKPEPEPTVKAKKHKSKPKEVVAAGISKARAETQIIFAARNNKNKGDTVGLKRHTHMLCCIPLYVSYEEVGTDESEETSESSAAKASKIEIAIPPRGRHSSSSENEKREENVAKSELQIERSKSGLFSMFGSPKPKASSPPISPRALESISSTTTSPAREKSSVALGKKEAEVASSTPSPNSLEKEPNAKTSSSGEKASDLVIAIQRQKGKGSSSSSEKKEVPVVEVTPKRRVFGFELPSITFPWESSQGKTEATATTTTHTQTHKEASKTTSNKKTDAKSSTENLEPNLLPDNSTSTSDKKKSKTSPKEN